MQKIAVVLTSIVFLFTFLVSPVLTTQVQAQYINSNCTDQCATADDFPACTSVASDDLGFKIPSLGDIITFVVRGFFVVAGLAGLLYMLLGAFAWVTSGGDKDAVSAAQQKIQAAVVGMLVIVGVLAIVWTMEQVVFNRRICLGLSCPLTLPGLIEADQDSNFCCSCINKETGDRVDVIDANAESCGIDGTAIQ